MEQWWFLYLEVYDMLWQRSIRFVLARAIWKCWAPLSCKLFIWHATQYYLWMADQRLRHGLQDQISACYICAQEEDSVDHILLHYVFIPQVWHCYFLRARIIIMLVPATNGNIVDWWTETRKRMPKENKGFDSIVMLICWHL